jgi:DNA polymerase-3 subunit delta
MKILPSNIDQFIKNISKQKIQGALLYGEDIGVLMARTCSIVKKFSEFQHLKFDLSSGAETIQSIFAETFIKSFFCENKLIQIDGSLETQFAGLQDLLIESSKVSDFSNFFLIVFNGTLDAKNKLRRYCESMENIAVIPCYADESGNLIQIIKEFLIENKLTMESATISYIVQNFKGNRSVLIAELEKLKTYKHQGLISLNDVTQVMQDEQESTVTTAVNYFFKRDVKSLEKSFEYLQEAGIPSGAVINSIVNHTLKLLEFVEEQGKTNKTFDIILAEKFIFFKQIPIIKEQLKFWNKSSLNQLLLQIMRAEIEGRKNASESFNAISLVLTEL